MSHRESARPAEVVLFAKHVLRPALGLKGVDPSPELRAQDAAANERFESGKLSARPARWTRTFRRRLHGQVTLPGSLGREAGAGRLAQPKPPSRALRAHPYAPA